MKTELTNLIRAGYPLLSVKTQEPLRFAAEAAAAGLAAGRRVYQWDGQRGLNEIGAETWDEIGAFALPAEIAENYPKSVIILNNFHFVIAENSIIQALQNWIPFFKSAAGQITLIIVSPGFTPPPELAREIREINFSLPGRDTLGGLLDALAAGQGITVEPDTREQLIDNLQGLTLAEAENALAWALVTDKGLEPLTVGTVKGQMVSSSAGLTFSTFTETLDTLKGNDNLKTWTLNRFKMRAGGRGRKALPFRGILLLGKPGNGKSHFSKALGRSVGWETVALDLGRIFGGLVGQSEENIDRALKILDAIAPCICFIDEIEKALAGAGGGSGTNETTVRVAAKFLQWLQDHESEIFVIATCNDIKTLAAASDGAFVRPGRWDAVFFIDNPDETQGREILDLYLTEYSGKALAEYEGDAPNLRDYSGAEIRQVAIECAYNSGDLAAAAAFVKPISKTNKEALDALTKWAAGRTEPAHKPATADTTRAINLT
jgi:hypothetical protein